MKALNNRIAKNEATNRMGRRRRTRLAIMIGATALTAPIAASPALAQDAKPASSEDQNVIIVTAQRRSEALENVPMTVTVLSQQTLKESGVDNIRDLANVTSGYQLGNSGSVPNPAIRGVTTTNAGSYENNVAVFIDNVYQVVPASLNIDLPNIQSVQILKGPQGTLYGRNATGGAILIDTITPGDEWEGKAELTYARFNDKRAGGYIAGPVSDRVGISLSGYIRRTDGWVKKASRTVAGQFDGTIGGIKQDSIRAKIRFQLTDNFEAIAGYAYTRVADANSIIWTQSENVRVDPATVPGANLTPTALGEATDDLPAVLTVKQHEGFLNLMLDTGIGQIRSITAYTTTDLETDFDYDGSYIPATYAYSTGRDQTWQQTIDVTVTAIDRLDLVVGGQYYNIKSSYPVPSTFLLGPASLGQPYDASAGTPISDYATYFVSDFDRTKEAWAVYADATFHATDRLSLNVGARFTQETQDVAGYRTSPFLPPYDGTGVVYDTRAYEAATGKRFRSKYHKFTPRASIRYEIAPRTNVYASYSRGFRSGEWNSQVPAIAGGLVGLPGEWSPVDPEVIDAYEIGIKAARRRLRWDVAGFYYDYKSLQVSQTTADANGNAIVKLQSGPAKIYGAEGSVDFEVTDNFNVHAGATWLHARYSKGFTYSGIGIDPSRQGYNTSSDPLKTFFNIELEQDLSGKQMARSPNFSAFLGFDYRIPDGDGGFVFAANAKYTDSYVVTDPSIWGGEPAAIYQARKAANPDALPDNAYLLRGTPYESRAGEERARQGSYVLINASITWTDPSGHYYVRAWGKNLTDKKYLIHYRPIGTGGTYRPIGEPLTFGLTVGVKMGPS